MENQQTITPEMIEERKAEMINYFDSQMELLEAQKRYETAITELEELRARRLYAAMKIAQIEAGPDSHAAESKEQPIPQQGRKLKAEK